MKKFMLIFISLLLFTWGWVAIFLHSQKQTQIKEQEKDTQNTQASHASWAINSKIEKQKEKTSEEKVQEKIKLIKERLALKGLILDGDTFSQNGQNTLALRNYLAYYKKNPNDPLILEKLWDTYFAMHKYTSAVSYYEKLSEIQENLILWLFYATDFWKIDSIHALNTKINTLNLTQEEKFYFNNSLKCSQDFHECKVRFSEYFEAKKQEQIHSTGALKKMHSALEDINIAIENYRNFHLDDVHLKNAYILWAWYKNKQYNLVAYLWEKTLSDRTDYKAIIKLVAQSYFKLWNYEKARDFLGKYNSIDDSDPNVSYMLWVVNTQLREYVLANIYISKALKLWYKDKIQAQRALIHNFSLIGDKENLLKQFKKLIEDFEYNENDFSLALYYHILYGDYDWPQKMFRSINEKFPENSNIYAYKWWIEREQWKLETAKKTLLLGEKLDNKNPFILLSLGYTEHELWNTWSALLYFKKAIAANPRSEFAFQAQKEIETKPSSSSWVLNSTK